MRLVRDISSLICRDGAAHSARVAGWRVAARTKSAFFRFLPLFAAALFAVQPLHSAPSQAALSPNAGFNDGIDRNDPDFVTASLLIMSPGDELYSCAGHSCIRLQCQKFNLDYCFSYESEGVKDKILTFFMGKLKMGMFAIPTADYLATGMSEGRGVMQYRLNLPPDAKQRLWKILDERVAQGPFLPYDYMARGCAQSALNVIMEALPPHELTVAQWPDKYLNWTRREFVREATQGYWWQQMPMCAICGTEADKATTRFDNVVVPLGLLEILRIGKVCGKSVIDGDGNELLPVVAKHEESGITLAKVFTPIMVSCCVVAISVVNCFAKWMWLDWIFLAIQSFAGMLFTYLVLFSSLPSTGWNWLFIPFNLLPLALWKWRERWAGWFAGLLALWVAWMILWPHFLTLPAYLLLVVAYTVMYARIGWQGRVCRLDAVVKPVSRQCADGFDDLRRRNRERRRG